MGQGFCEAALELCDQWFAFLNEYTESDAQSSWCPPLSCHLSDSDVFWVCLKPTLTGKLGLSIEGDGSTGVFIQRVHAASPGQGWVLPGDRLLCIGATVLWQLAHHHIIELLVSAVATNLNGVWLLVFRHPHHRTGLMDIQLNVSEDNKLRYRCYRRRNRRHRSVFELVSEMIQHMLMRI